MFTNDIEQNRKTWIAALRSGAYTQVKNALRTPFGFCVLGVACQISGVGKWDNGFYITESFDEKPWIVPEEVLHAFALDINNVDDTQFLAAITRANDAGVRFVELADEIESYLSGKE